jgi:secreted trypsin-like serine protease
MMVAILLFVFVLFSNINSISATTYACNQSSSCGCSALSTIVTSKIVGGEAAANYTWGWMASFQLAGAHQCGASLLTPEYAVTAAHCVEDLALRMSQLSIVVGTNYWNGSSPTMQRRSIISMTKYPTFNDKNNANDIGILQFAPLDVSSGSEISFICLPEQNQDPFQTNTSLVAIGWGVTSQNSITASNYLQQVTVQVLSASEGCTAAAGLADPTSQFCAGVSTGGKGKFLL